VWKALDISYDTFVQTSSERHKQCCRKFIQKVYDNGHIYKGKYEGWYCPGCEEFKSDKVHAENAGLCPNHKRPLIRRSEPCWYFKLSAFQDRLLAFLKENPDFVQPESRRNEMIGFIGKDITRFHTHIWPAMLWAAGEEAPKKVFSHGFVYLKNEDKGSVEKISKSLGNVIEPMEVISKFSADAFRYYFLRECPYPSD